jgi:hypothetical protein
MIKGKSKSFTSNGISRRTSTRIRAHGILTLTDLDEPIIARIFDIAPGGLSFLHLNDLSLPSGEITMDIIIFDDLTNFEYFINEAKGRIISKHCISDPEIGTPFLRFGVEFFELDSLHQDVLKACFDQIAE